MDHSTLKRISAAASVVGTIGIVVCGCDTPIGIPAETVREVGATPDAVSSNETANGGGRFSVLHSLESATTSAPEMSDDPANSPGQAFACSLTSSWYGWHDGVTDTICDVVYFADRVAIVLAEGGCVLAVDGVDQNMEGLTIDDQTNIYLNGIRIGYVEYAEDSFDVARAFATSFDGHVLSTAGISTAFTPGEWRSRYFDCDACNSIDHATPELCSQVREPNGELPVSGEDHGSDNGIDYAPPVVPGPLSIFSNTALMNMQWKQLPVPEMEIDRK